MEPSRRPFIETRRTLQDGDGLLFRDQGSRARRSVVVLRLPRHTKVHVVRRPKRRD